METHLGEWLRVSGDEHISGVDSLKIDLAHVVQHRDVEDSIRRHTARCTIQGDHDSSAIISGCPQLLKSEGGGQWYEK